MIYLCLPLIHYSTLQVLLHDKDKKVEPGSEEKKGLQERVSELKEDLQKNEAKMGTLEVTFLLGTWAEQ